MTARWRLAFSLCARTKPQRQTQHVAAADDPWLAELDHAFGDLEGKVATADVWKVLKLSSYGRTMDDQMRLTAVMRLLGWDRRLLRFRNQQVGRGFVRGAICARSTFLSARSAVGSATSDTTWRRRRPGSTRINCPS